MAAHGARLHPLLPYRASCGSSSDERPARSKGRRGKGVGNSKGVLEAKKKKEDNKEIEKTRRKRPKAAFPARPRLER